MTATGATDTNFGIYVHWPFCQSKCPYCDFNSHVADRVDMARWASAYLSEVDRMAEETRGHRVRSVFFGGGTPSLMDPELVDAILRRVRERWVIANDCEVTLEANPTSVESEKFRAFRSAGVNRVSMGIQALNDPDLKRLGRLHSAEEAMRALDIARETFERVSFDLIYARQHQTVQDWEAELTQALSLAPDHLSLYQLTIEDGTAFGDRFARGKLAGLPDDDRSAAMYEATQALCEAAGLPAYEISNHARPGSESVHNSIYWRGGEYLGIGPGAHGRLSQNGQRWATVALRSPSAWLAQVETKGHGEAPRESISAQDQATEYLMMSLRLREGLDRRKFLQIAGRDLPEAPLAEIEALGLLTVTESRVATTSAGRLILNAVIRRLADEL